MQVGNAIAGYLYLLELVAAFCQYHHMVCSCLLQLYSMHEICPHKGLALGKHWVTRILMYAKQFPYKSRSHVQ